MPRGDHAWREVHTSSRRRARPSQRQFAGWQRLSFHLAPPLLARPGADGRIGKIEFGGWMWTAMKWLDLALRLARLPESIRGFGHVKLANAATAKAQWAELLDRYRRRAIDAAPQPVAVVPRVKSVAEL